MANDLVWNKKTQDYGRDYWIKKKSLFDTNIGIKKHKSQRNMTKLGFAILDMVRFPTMGLTSVLSNSKIVFA